MTQTQPLILCIETSGPLCSVALFRGSEMLAASEESAPYSHSEKLTLMIQQLFDSNSLKPSELSAVAVSRGPGSYTGLRIGTSVAKGFCYALNIPLLAADTMLLLADMALAAEKAAENTIVIPMTDARRMEVYCAVYSSDLQVLRPVHARIMDAESFTEYSNKQLLLCGDGAAKCADLFAGRQLAFSPVIHPSAASMGTLALSLFETGKYEDIAYFEPYYLKDFVATASKKK